MRYSQIPSLLGHFAACGRGQPGRLEFSAASRRRQLPGEYDPTTDDRLQYFRITDGLRRYCRQVAIDQHQVGQHPRPDRAFAILFERRVGACGGVTPEGLLYGDLLLALAEGIAASVSRPGVLLLSGILWEYTFPVRQCYERLGFAAQATYMLEEYSTILFHAGE